MRDDDFEIEDFDIAQHLRDEETVAAYLTEVARLNNYELLLSAIGDIARAYGMGKIAKQANVNRESLYKSLSKEGNPSFATVVSVLNALGVTLKFSYDYQK